MSDARTWLRENWRIALAVFVGAVVVFVVGLRTDNMVAVLITGLIVGILVGGLISAMSKEKQKGQRRKR